MRICEILQELPTTMNHGRCATALMVVFLVVAILSTLCLTGVLPMSKEADFTGSAIANGFTYALSLLFFTLLVQATRRKLDGDKNPYRTLDAIFECCVVNN